MEAGLIELVQKYPLIAQILMGMGIARVVFKPAMLLVQTFVEATPGKADDSFWEKIKASVVYKGVSWVVDFFGSIKLPQAGK